MRTEEQLQEELLNGFTKLCKGVSDEKQEFVKLQLKDESSELSKLAAAKKAAADAYDRAEGAYLLQTSVGDSQYVVVLKAVAQYATAKNDKGFLMWIRDNNKLSSINELVADTPTKLLRFLNRLYKSYADGRLAANERKAAIAAEKAAAAKAIADLKASGMSIDEILAEFDKQ